MENGLKKLNELNWSYRASRVLHVANGIGLFDALSVGELSAEQAVKRLKTNPEMTEKLLIACVSLGLLEKTGEFYKNSLLADEYLVRGKPLYQGNIIAHSASVWNFWTNLEQGLYTPPTIPTNRSADEHKNFILGMHNIALAGRAQMFADNFDLSGRKKLFDVGGGPGTYSIAACKRYPNLKAVVFDLPETIAIARQIIDAEGMQDRVSVKEGDWATADFGRDNDVVLFSNVLHGPSSGAESKLSKAFDSMTSGAMLVIQEFLLNNDKTGPAIPALFNVMVEAYSVAELVEVIKRAGFTNPEIAAQCPEMGSTWLSAKKP